jgi:hypothetical protein
MWILTTPNPAVVPVYNSTDMERHLVRDGGNRVMRQFLLACTQQSLCVLLGHFVLVHESSESHMLLGAAFCVAHCAPLNTEFLTAS